MKLLYYSTAYYSSHGGSNHSQAFVKFVKKNQRGVTIEVFPGKTDVENSILQKSGFRKMIRSFSLFQIFFFLRRNQFHLKSLVDQIRIFQPDILHIRLDSNFLQIRRIKKKFPDLIVTTEVNASPFDESFKNIMGGFIFRWIERKCMAIADLNFFVSDFLRRRIMGEEIINNRDYVCHNGVDIEIFNREMSWLDANEEFHPVIVYAGTIDNHKGLPELVKAFDMVHAVHTDARLLIIGDGPGVSDLKKSISILQLDNAVSLTGWVKHDEIAFILRKANIAIHHCANKYMSPLKIFEYMAVGLPVIGPDTPAVKEVFTDGEHLVVVRNEVKDIADKILLLIENRSLRRLIARNGYHLVNNSYTWVLNVEFILSKMEGIIRKAS